MYLCVICPRHPTHMGIHQTLACETSPWESHPCRVLRQLRREVSLYPARVVAIPGAARYSHWGLSLGRLFDRLGVPNALARRTGNVPDVQYSVFNVHEWRFSFGKFILSLYMDTQRSFFTPPNANFLLIAKHHNLRIAVFQNYFSE